MSKNNYTMVQCDLAWPDGRRSTAWLPEEFAVIGKSIQIKEGEEWYDWIVSKWYIPPLDNVYVRERSEDYKKTRKASDI